jgi:hypothetical protein
MSLSGDRLARAEARSAQARVRLEATALELKERLKPRHLLEDALDEARRLGETGAARAKRHPFAVATVVALFSALALRSRRRKAHEATDAASESLPIKRGYPRRPRRV